MRLARFTPLLIVLILALLAGCHHQGSGPGGSWHL